MLGRFRDQISERWAAFYQVPRKYLVGVVLNALWYTISALFKLLNPATRSSWGWVVVLLVPCGVMLLHHVYFVFTMEVVDLLLASGEMMWLLWLQFEIGVGVLSQWSSVFQILNALSFVLLGISLILLLFARVCTSLRRPAGGFRFLPVLHVLDNLYQDPPMPEESSTGADLHLANIVSRVPSSHARLVPSAELPWFSPFPPEGASTRSGVLNTKIRRVHWKAASRILLGRSAWVDPVTQSADYPWFRAFVYAALVSGFFLFTALRILIDPIREIGHPLLVESIFSGGADYTLDSAPLWNILARIKSYANGSDIWPDLLITVNFTALGMDSGTLGNNCARTVYITVALTDQIDDIISDSSPIPLIPNLYLLATVTTALRERYKWTAAATLGILTFTKVHFTTGISLLVSDPSPLIPRIDNTATLRLYMPLDLSDWRMFSDGRQHSVLSGLIDLGGLWTPVNGAITVIFGMNMLMLWWGMYGSSSLSGMNSVLHPLGKKPLSIFGWIHKINRGKVVARMKERYPGLENDVSTSPGWGAFLRDFLVDMELVSSSNISANTGDTHPHSTESSTISPARSSNDEDSNHTIISDATPLLPDKTAVEMDDLTGNFGSTSSSTISPAPSSNDEDSNHFISSDTTPLIRNTTPVETGDLASTS
ncbi:hypothetical protein DFH09DRAFT_1086588 [Mycena vulgaris]|nr:hypothetical protein DFH09DRAFT_1086588 [Mycena vulgaris]